VGSVVLDASAVIALLTPEDAHHRRMVDALRDLGRHVPHVPAVAFAEVLVGALRRGDRYPEVVEGFCNDPGRVVDLTEAMARGGAGLRAANPGLGLADALIIATGEALEADAIVTADASWTSVSNRVRVI